MKSYCTRLTNVIQASKANDITVAPVFFEKWLTNFGILSALLIETTLQLVLELVDTVCRTLTMNNISGSDHQTERKG